MRYDDQGWGEPEGDPGYSELLPTDLLPQAIRSPYANADAARMGLDRNSVAGAELHFFANLNASRPSHKVVAWLALVVFVLPVLLTVLNLLRQLSLG